MPIYGSVISDVIIGDPLRIDRNVFDVPSDLQVSSATLKIKNLSSDADNSALLITVISVAPAVGGQISLLPSSDAVHLVFLVSGSFTAQLIPGRNYFYSIDIEFSDQSSIPLENGNLVGRLATDYSSLVALSTSASASTYGPRVATIIDRYVDVILHEFRQLRVWDEHARRSAYAPNVFQTAYKSWNPAFLPQIATAQNEYILPSDYQINYDDGTFQVTSDDGNEDYFVTYEFNLFPAHDLFAMLQLTLQETNLGGMANGGYITNYTSVDEAPGYWDAPLTLGVCAKAFRRLATESGLWKNYLIWVSDNNGPSLAKEAADYYQTQFESVIQSIKKLHFIAAPSSAYAVFQSIGFGALGLNSDKFRGLRINKIAIF